MAWHRAFRLTGVGWVVVWGVLIGGLAGCQPQANVAGYWLSHWLGTQPPPVSEPSLGDFRAFAKVISKKLTASGRPAPYAGWAAHDDL